MYIEENEKIPRFADINIFDVNFCVDDEKAGLNGDFLIDTTDELIDITNQIRKEKGYVDLVSEKIDNEVYYTFYLCFNADKKEVQIKAICNGAEKDDYEEYELPLTKDEERILLYKIIKELINEEINQ